MGLNDSALNDIAVGNVLSDSVLNELPVENVLSNSGVIEALNGVILIGVVLI